MNRATSNEHTDLLTLFVSWQKMDKNRDGVVTIDEFIDCCQNVSLFLFWMWFSAWMSFLKTFTIWFSWVERFERKAPYILFIEPAEEYRPDESVSLHRWSVIKVFTRVRLFPTGREHHEINAAFWERHLTSEWTLLAAQLT